MIDMFPPITKTETNYKVKQNFQPDGTQLLTPTIYPTWYTQLSAQTFLFINTTPSKYLWIHT